MELIFNTLKDIYLWLEEPCTEHPHYKGFGYNDEISCEKHRRDCYECWGQFRQVANINQTDKLINRG